MDRIAKLAVGVTLGIGAVLASAGALYLMIKTDDNDDDDQHEQRSIDRMITQGRTEMVRVRIPKDQVGAVIGRNGEMVKHIQRETKTRIHFDPDDHTDCRYAVIRGSAETVKEAEKLINDIVKEQPSVFTSELAVPFASVGTIIGRGGEVIRAIQQESGAKINIARIAQCPSNGLNPVTIKGSPEQILAAKNLIDERIAENETRLHNFSTKGNGSYKYKGRPMAIEAGRVDGDMRDLLEENWSEPSVDNLDNIADNGCMEVYVAAVESPDKFWLQKCGPTGTQLDRLCDRLTDFYEVESNRTRTTLVSLPVKVGDIVAAPYAGDEHYYRVRIVSIDEDNYAPEETPVRVFYLDFGDEATHLKKNLYNLNDDLLHFMPFQAIECKLHGVKPRGSVEWSEEALKLFSEEIHCAQWKPVHAKPIRKVKSVNGKSQTIIVDLFDVQSSEKEVNIAELLISRGFAQPVVDNVNGQTSSN